MQQIWVNSEAEAEAGAELEQTKERQQVELSQLGTFGLCQKEEKINQTDFGVCVLLNGSV